MENTSSDDIGKHMMSLIFLYLGGIALATFTQVIIAMKFGATDLTDIYVIGTTIPNLLTIFFTQITGVIFIPAFAFIYHKKSPEDFWRVFSTLFIFVSGFLLIIALVFFGWSGLIAKLIAPGFLGPKLLLTGNFIKLIAFSLLLSGLARLLATVHQFRHKYNAPAMIPMIKYLFIFLMIYFLSGRINIFSAALGFLIGSIGEFLVVLPGLFKQGFKIKYLRINIASIKLLPPKFVNLFLWAIGLMVLQQIIVLIDRVWASKLGNSSLALLNFSYYIFLVPLQLTSQTASLITFTKLTEKISLKDYSGENQFINAGIRYVFFIAIPIAILIFLFWEDIIRVIYLRGKFDADAMYKTGFLTIMFGLAIVPKAFSNLINKVFHANMNLKPRCYVLLLITILKILFNYIFLKYVVHFMPVSALVMSTVTISIIDLLIMFLLLKSVKSHFKLDIKQLLTTFSKIMFSLFIAYSITILLNNYFIADHLKNIIDNIKQAEFVISILKIFLFGIFYFVSLRLMKSNELEFITSRYLK